MKIISSFTLAILLSFSCHATTIFNDSFEYIPSPPDSCKQAPWCDFLAEQVSWPKTTPLPIHISNLAFEVKIPYPFRKMSIINSLFVAHYEKYNISVSVEDYIDIEEIDEYEKIEPYKKTSRYTQSQLFDILFLKTTKDAEPSNLYERRLWRMAFVNKAQFYKQARDAVITKKDSWSIYSVYLPVRAYRRVTIVSHKNHNQYLKIMDNGAPLDVVMNIAAQVRSKLVKGE